MKYNFNEIEDKWQKYWAKHQTFKTKNDSEKPKYYVLDMFPYPSGAGLHVGHPLGYIATDIYARYKRHKGFNVLHPQGYDSFGLPAEQYAIQTGQHPAITTQENIKTYRRQLDKMGFSFDWSREVRTSSPEYYKWTQWVFVELFGSWYNNESDKAEPISSLVERFILEGNKNVNAACNDAVEIFSAEAWKGFSSKKQQEILLQYRLTYLAKTEVNWCPALGTVLANDEIVNGISERGGHPVIRKKMTQWSMRISAYAERLLQGLETIDWTDSLKETQRNWIGKSVGTSVTFKVLPLKNNLERDKILSPTLSKEKRDPKYLTGNPNTAHLLLENAKKMRANPTQAEAVLWQQLKGKKLDIKFRKQHLIEDFIVDFVCLSKQLIIEVDGKIHDSQKEKDTQRTEILKSKGYKVIRFTNQEVISNINAVVSSIKKELKERQALPLEKDLGGEIEVFTTRPDTIFGTSFMTLAPEHDLVSKITTPKQKAEVDAYIKATAKRSERDRMADVKTISGVFTGAYAEHPFTKAPIPIWIGDYVLAGYGTGAVMSVPCGDQRDYDFAKHFNIPIPNIFEGVDISKEAYADKNNTIIANSDFLNRMPYKKACKRVIYELEQLNQGEGKTNYRLRDAVFSRQRYWGEPFPIYYKNGMPQIIDAKHLPIKLPNVEKYLPTETGEPPLGRADVWAWCTETNTIIENEKINSTSVFPLELNTMPGWAGSSCYSLRYMDPLNTKEIASQDALKYWENVDLYIGGIEHATGHLLYSRFWVKFLYDRGFVGIDEPFKKIINQGMILGTSAFVHRRLAYCSIKSSQNIFYDPLKIEAEFISFNNEINTDDFFKDEERETSILGKIKKGLPILDHISYLKKIFSDTTIIIGGFNDLSREEIIDKLDNINIEFSNIAYHVDVSFVNASNELDIEKFKNWRSEYKDAIFIGENGEILPLGKDLGWEKQILPLGKDLGWEFKVSREPEKMSKSKYNVVSPDAICEQYGADSLRLYEMFLGPLEQYKPWNTSGITGVHSFLKKLWKLYHTGENGAFYVSDTPLEEQKEALKTLHKTIKKVQEDIENFSFNTSVSTFMIAVNELTAQKCTSKNILEPLLILISPYAPHIAEELWSLLGHKESISTAEFPIFEASHLVESNKNYPISFNGKMRFTMELPLAMSKEDIEAAVLSHQKTKEQLQGCTPKKVIVVLGKIVNIVS